MGHKKHRTKTNKTIKHDITLKTKMMSNTDPTKNRGGDKICSKEWSSRPRSNGNNDVLTIIYKVSCRSEHTQYIESQSSQTYHYDADQNTVSKVSK